MHAEVWNPLRFVGSDLSFISEDCTYFCVSMTFLMLVHLSRITCFLHILSCTSHTPCFSHLSNTCSLLLRRYYTSMKCLWSSQAEWIALPFEFSLVLPPELLRCVRLFIVCLHSLPYNKHLWIDLGQCTISYTLTEKGEASLDRESGQRHATFHSFGNLMFQGRCPVTPPLQLTPPDLGSLILETYLEWLEAPISQ